jgi:hypothetical protein
VVPVAFDTLVRIAGGQVADVTEIPPVEESKRGE